MTNTATALVYQPISALRPYPRNARTHSKKQVQQIARSIERFGFTNPVLVSDDGEIIAGHGRVRAAALLGMESVPTLALSHLSEAERRAYVLADNKLALNAGWDSEILAIELQGLLDSDFDVTLTGFSLAEVDFTLDAAADAKPSGAASPDDYLPRLPSHPVSRSGDLWQLGRHGLLCGDAREEAAYVRLLGNAQADLIFTDPPYNVAIDGHVSGLGKVKHAEFAMASGEMSEAEFTTFLQQSLGAMAQVSRDGAIAFVCMDWRHMGELLSAGRSVFSELKNLIVWNKTNGGMGAFYRSKHELIFAWKVGSAPHTNTFGLGETGRYRTNVWDYAGISSMSASRAEELAMHPTVKPVALIADAICDCSKRGEIVLDGFGGSGSTLIAAEKTGRAARLIEYEPGYCDVIIARWQQFTGAGGARRQRHDLRGCGRSQIFDSRGAGHRRRGDRRMTLPDGSPASSIASSTGGEDVDEHVGYGRPPRAHQFKPGQSGNPRGRPRKARPPADATLSWGESTLATGRIASELVNVVQNGKPVTMTAIEAVHRRRFNDALKGGNRLLQREVIAEANAYERIQLEAELKRFAALRAQKAEGAKRIAEARSRGLPEPMLVPHPDDIVIDEEAMTAKVIGPDTQDALALMNFAMLMRDHFVLRAVYQERFPPLLAPLPKDHYASLQTMAETINETLCPRLQWGPSGFWKAAQPWQRRGFRCTEAALHDSLHKLDGMWRHEPALAPLRRQKRLADIIRKMLAFQSRSRERAIAQRHYNMLRSAYAMAFGDAAVARLPKGGCSPARP